LDSDISADLAVIARDLKSFADTHSDKKICWSNYGDDIITDGKCDNSTSIEDKIFPFLASADDEDHADTYNNSALSILEGIGRMPILALDIALNVYRVIAYSAHPEALPKYDIGGAENVGFYQRGIKLVIRNVKNSKRRV
jgi:hypothetical protein